MTKIFNTDTQRQCAKCGKVKSLDEFVNHKGVKQDKDYYCKPCFNEKSKDWIRRNKYQHLQIARDFYWKNRDRLRSRKTKSPPIWLRENLRVKAKVRRSDPLNKIKNKARDITKYATKIKLIEKRDTCQICGEKKRLTRHHNDYSKPLDIIWVCTGCHGAVEAYLNYYENK